MCDNCETVKRDPRQEGDDPRPKREHRHDPRPQMATDNMASRATAAQMLFSEAASLRHQADQLEALAKIAAFAEGTPAEEALWSLVIRSRR